MRFSNGSSKATTKEGMESLRVGFSIDKILVLSHTKFYNKYRIILQLLNMEMSLIFTSDIFSDETSIKTNDPKVR